MVVCFGGCNPERELSPEKYVRWVQDTENGLIKTKRLKGLQLEARYLPAPYLAYREFKSLNETVAFDSLLSAYTCGLAFQFTLSASLQDREYGNLMYYETTSQEDLMARQRYLSFSGQEFIHLEYNGQTLLPALVQFEGYDALTNSLRFQASFESPMQSCGGKDSTLASLTFVFDDPFWNSGTTRFLWEENVLEKIPQLKF